MKCPQCQHDNADSQKFCGECGARLVVACPACQAVNPPTNKFCGECAAPLKEPPRQVAEERKTVTALFCDLVGFTATSELADPEDVNTMLDAYGTMARSSGALLPKESRARFIKQHLPSMTLGATEFAK